MVMIDAMIRARQGLDWCHRYIKGYMSVSKKAKPVLGPATY